METLQAIGIFILIIGLFLFLFYGMSKLQMRAWLTELESFFEDKLNSLKKEEHGKEEE